MKRIWILKCNFNIIEYIVDQFTRLIFDEHFPVLKK